MERFGADLGRQTELSGPRVVEIHARHPYVRFLMLSAALDVITKPPDQSPKKVSPCKDPLREQVVFCSEVYISLFLNPPKQGGINLTVPKFSFFGGFGAFGADTLSPSYSYQLVPLYPNLDREDPLVFRIAKN